MEEFHHYFHQSREIFDNGGNDRITSSDENLIQIFIKDENKSEYFHQIVPISTDSSGFIDRKKIVWIQRRSSFPPRNLSNLNTLGLMGEKIKKVMHILLT